jgi:hypothetical protein
MVIASSLKAYEFTKGVGVVSQCIVVNEGGVSNSDEASAKLSGANIS